LPHINGRAPDGHAAVGDIVEGKSFVLPDHHLSVVSLAIVPSRNAAETAVRLMVGIRAIASPRDWLHRGHPAQEMLRPLERSFTVTTSSTPFVS
jgi:hypothetical protein